MTSKLNQRNVRDRWFFVNGLLAALAIIIALVVPLLLSPRVSASASEIEAQLTGAPINGVTPRGEAEFDSAPGEGDEFKVTVENVNLPAGTVLNVTVDGTKVGTLTLPGNLMRAELDLKTERGQTLPPINSRSRVVVATQPAVTVVAGSFSNISATPTPTPTGTATPTPTPTGTATPTPTPTPTPNPNAEIHLEARLAGAAIDGLTPIGEAKFRQEQNDRRLKVEVEKVNRPAGTILNVLVNNLKIGELTLNSGMEAEFALRTDKGQPVPNMTMGSTVVITDSQAHTILSGVFNTLAKEIENENEIDDPDFFVEQHFRDFLSREADDSGLAFWTNEIKKCGTNASCTDDRRVNTSGAFFLSTEFQETGYLLYRFNKASFGTMPRRNQFLVDMESAALGVVVGTTGWEQKLEDNKRRVADDLAERPEFKQRFDSLSDDKFVDTLFANAGVRPAEAERNDLIKGLQEHRETRGAVLRSIAENAEFNLKESNSAFVLMQYFGYLHRNPDEGADHDMSGFNFWLKKLNDFGGDFHQAEMVRAFIQSSEYRNRFDW